MIFRYRFAEKSPPTILVRLPNGSSAIDSVTNQVVIYPGSIVHLECLFKRKDGDPEWSWSTGQQHRLFGEYTIPNSSFERHDKVVENYFGELWRN